MENLSVYHGPIGKKEGERRLALDGRDGCFLVRNSDSVPDVYCLCVLCNGIVFTYRLQQHDGGSWAADTIPGVPKRHFRKIKNLIAAFQQPGQGIAIPLLYPVTAQGWVQTPTEVQTPSNSLSPPHSSSSTLLQSYVAQGQENEGKNVMGTLG
ncbi:SH2 domain containing 1A duplicate a [Hippocampus comes]|uniref:SH2 domain containing 1A duplicate a n=1 Tax=Hippocampus comes TaxID=109280 RepID=UPI00094EEEBB|nr:PREDICTED: SH2 domain-containing protein 1A-like [Hippocampus comes]